MIAGLLALMLVSGDTATVTPPTADTLKATPIVALDSTPVLAPSGPISAPTAVDSVDAGPRLIWRPVAITTPTSLLSPLGTAPDTVVKKKRVLVEYSDWYGRRLAVHRTLTWAMIPLFAVSYYTGERLARDGRLNSPYAIRALHPYAATGAAAVFGVNTVTGLWNLWDARHDPEGRKRRLLHSALFIIADAGFAYAGSIGEESRESSAIRNKHRTVALSSMGVSYVGMMIMLLGGK